jgi:hypothetical protein
LDQALVQRQVIGGPTTWEASTRGTYPGHLFSVEPGVNPIRLDRVLSLPEGELTMTANERQTPRTDILTAVRASRRRSRIASTVRRGSIRGAVAAVGFAVLLALSPGEALAGLGPHDTATGTGALAHESGGEDNTADGYRALYSNTTGADNTAAGEVALNSNITGSDNTAAGEGALESNTTGIGNTATGDHAPSSNADNYNAAAGFDALLSNTTGGNNLAVGTSSLRLNTTAVRTRRWALGQGLHSP